jgi:hypothetical protein
LGALLQENFVDVAPLPAFARLKRPHDGVLGLIEMLGRVGVPGRIAAAHVAADKAFPQMYPAIAHLQAFLAAFAAGSYFFNFFDVGAGGLEGGHGVTFLCTQHSAFSHCGSELVSKSYFLNACGKNGTRQFAHSTWSYMALAQTCNG